MYFFALSVPVVLVTNLAEIHFRKTVRRYTNVIYAEYGALGIGRNIQTKLGKFFLAEIYPLLLSVEVDLGCKTPNTSISSTFLMAVGASTFAMRMYFLISSSFISTK